MKKVSAVYGVIGLALIALLLLTLTAGSFRDHIAWARSSALKILINNNATELKPVESGGTLFVPLNFPLEEGKSNWKVTLEYDKTKGTVNIEKAISKEKLRGDTTCPRCGGNGKCQACYPAGSGKNISGDGPCYACDGSGKCFYCNGNGSY